MYGNEYAAHTASSRARATNAAADVSTLVANENTGGGNVNSASANSYELFKRVMSNTKHKPMMGKLNKQVSHLEWILSNFRGGEMSTSSSLLSLLCLRRCPNG